MKPYSQVMCNCGAGPVRLHIWVSYSSLLLACTVLISRVSHGHGKSWNVGRPFSRPGKSWKIVKVMKSHGKWRCHVIFTTALSSSVKVTQIMNRNVVLLTQFALVYLLTNFLWWYCKQLELSLIILVCIYKSYGVYFEISIVPIGHQFSFFGHGKVMENQCWKKRWHPA